MPTITSTTAHRVAALLAVEREAVRVHVQARVKMFGAAGYSDYERAAQVDESAYIALLNAQRDVDEALAAAVAS